MEKILISAFGAYGMIMLGVILMAFVGYYIGHEKGYAKGRRDERIKQYKQMQSKKANFIDAD